MHPNRILKWTLSLVLLFVVKSFAAVKDIRSAQLPQVPSVQKTLSDVAELEPYAKNWSGKWQYDVPKATVVARMKTSLKVLQSALKDNPDNLELLLLTGLTAHYAYNLDVDSANDLVKESLERAHMFAPNDVRTIWFRDIHLCEANFVDLGMTGFLEIERSPAAAQVPPDFWEDYMECATLANMPAHVLRAATKVAATERSDFMTLLIERANEKFTPADPQSSYAVKQVWSSTKGNGGPIFINSMCGVSFWANGEWKLNFPNPQKGRCVAQMETGPYSNKGMAVIPNILLLVRPAGTGETLKDFLKSFIRDPDPSSIPALSCPTAHCIAAEVVVKDRYKESGDGHAIFTVFERDEPQFPGILFEEPAGPKVPSDGVIHAFQSGERIKRFNGKMYYLVLLDSAASVLDFAKKDYESYLKSMQVE